MDFRVAPRMDLYGKRSRHFHTKIREYAENSFSGVPKIEKSCAGLCPTQLIKCFTFVFLCTMYRYKIVFKIVITSSSVSPVVLMLM